MADSFFGFNTSLTGLELGDAPDLDEEEYDALNHETFGENAFQGDWEEDHTRFAEVTENSRIYKNSCDSDKDELDLETSISQLVLEEGEEEDHSKHKNLDLTNIPDTFKLENRISCTSSPVWSIDNVNKNDDLLSKQLKQACHPSVTQSSSLHFLPPQVPRIPTVQELERDLIQKNKQTAKNIDKEVKSNFNYDLSQCRNSYPQTTNQHANINTSNSTVPTQNTRSKFTHSSGNNSYPPGFGAQQRGPFPQLSQQEMVLLRNNQNVPIMLGPRLMPPYILPTPHPLLLAQNARLMSQQNMMRFVPPHPVLMLQQLHQQQNVNQNKVHRSNQGQSECNKNNSGQNKMNNGSNNIGFIGHPCMSNPDRRGAGDFDEYAGLMNLKERQWLRNIQLIQLSSEKSHACDYYYNEWMKKQCKEKKSTGQTNNCNQYREPFFSNNRPIQLDGNHRDRRDSDHDSTATPSPRVYVPLQFENSLGKLQCGSVTAPRKIIDLDVVSEPHAEVTSVPSHRDSRKTKKLLLELERLYLLAMDVEDIDNNVELEEPHLSKSDLIERIMTSFLSEDRFINFMCIRKGKTLLLRILPHLNELNRKDYISDLWCRLIKALTTVVRRDQNDGLLLQIYPFFKEWINTTDYANLSLLATFLLPGNVTNHLKSASRAASPSSGKSVLSYALTSKFGVSVISNILSQGEVIYPNLEDREKLDWTTFIFNFVKHMTTIQNLENIPTPLDPLPTNVLTAILNRSTGLHIQDYATAKRVLNIFQ